MGLHPVIWGVTLLTSLGDVSLHHSGEKVPKPISGRVKEIAEFVLACVMEKVVSSIVFVFAEHAQDVK